MHNLTIVVPFWNGHEFLPRLLDSLPPGLPVIVVDDHSDEPLHLNRDGVRVIRPEHKGFFSGAVNAGVDACGTDVLILNQDAWFTSPDWLVALDRLRGEYALIGDAVYGHPAWPEGYVQGTFMFVRRDAWCEVGPLNVEDYPLWGSTCEWQLRACRKGYKAKPLKAAQWMQHQERKRFGSAIEAALARWPGRKREFIRTPPAVSVIVPCFNYGRYLRDAINSLVGGETSLGEMPGQSLASFEVIIVDDASTDGETPDLCDAVADPWRGIKVLHLERNRGTAGAINAGIEASHAPILHVLSADDMREPWALETLYRALNEDMGRVVYGDMVLFKDGKRLKGLQLPDYDFDSLLYKNPMSAGIMYARAAWKAVGGYPEQMRYGREDWAFNIALGLAGYCGYKVDWGERGPGELYRREGQNRSLRNKSKDWKKRFLYQLMALFPGAYRGERPVGCCGGRQEARVKRGLSAKNAKALPGQDGMAILQYIGGNHGTISWYGPVTGQRYKAGLSNPIIYVDSRDAPGMLATLVGKRRVFRVFPADVNPVTPEQAAQVNPDAPEVALIEEPELEPEDLTTVKGIGKSTAVKFTAAGVRAVADIARMTPGEVSDAVGISFGRAMTIIQAAQAARPTNRRNDGILDKDELLELAEIVIADKAAA